MADLDGEALPAAATPDLEEAARAVEGDGPGPGLFNGIEFLGQEGLRHFRVVGREAPGESAAGCGLDHVLDLEARRRLEDRPRRLNGLEVVFMVAGFVVGQGIRLRPLGKNPRQSFLFFPLQELGE